MLLRSALRGDGWVLSAPGAVRGAALRGGKRPALAGWVPGRRGVSGGGTRLTGAVFDLSVDHTVVV